MTERRRAARKLFDCDRSAHTFVYRGVSNEENAALQPTPESIASVAVGHKRARFAVAALAVAALFETVQAFSYAAQTRLLESCTSGFPDDWDAVSHANDVRVTALAALGPVVRVAGIVFFLRWFHRAVRNARVIQHRVLLGRPGEAVLSFFVPVLNFVRPASIVKKLHSAMDPEVLPPATTIVDVPDADYRTAARRVEVASWTRVTAPIGLWWAFYLLDAIGSQILLNGGNVGASIQALATQSRFVCALSAIGAISSFLGIWIVRAIDARTQELMRRLQSRAAATDEEAAPAALQNPG